MPTLIILQPDISHAERAAVVALGQPRQMASEGVFITEAGSAAVEKLRSMRGVARVLRGGETSDTLPPLSDSERLFVDAWLSSFGPAKQRPGDQRDWDTPGMQPPDDAK